MEDQERQKKLEAGKAKLAKYRQRKAEAGGQKKSKKKKKNAGKQGASEKQHTEERDPSLGEERAQHRANTPTSEYTFSRKLHSGETVKHDQTFTIEPESEVSTTAEDYSSEEENMESSESRHDDEAGDLHLRLQTAEDELAEKQRNMEELTKELEEIRAAFSTELQNFEAAINQRDDIITQLTTNLQLARKEKDDIMREFQEMTDQSQKLQIQFQQLQAGETLRNSSHSNTAADLLQARVQITSIQQQVEQRETEAKVHLEKIDELQRQVTQLQHRLNQSETLGRTQEENFLQRLNEKDELITEQKRIMTEHESLLTILKNDLEDTKKSLSDSKEQSSEQSQELERCRSELSSSKQREQVSSSEIRLLMGTVEDLQKRSHKGSQSESDLVRRLELDTERKMDRLRAELDEIHGQQIVQMKRELQMQHSLETDRLMERDKSELELLRAQSTTNLNEMNALNVKIAELTQNIEEVQTLKMKLERELLSTSEEKLNLLSEVEDLKRELCSFRRAEEGSLSVINQDKRRAEIQRLEATISRLEAHLAAAEEANRDLESKHESEITNYKIKLEMLEREKDAVLSLMAESQEAELEKLRTQMLFSHEEELATLRADLQKESALQLENLKDEMTLKQKHTLHNMQKSLQEQLQAMKSEKENLATEKLALLNKIKVLEEYLSRPSDSTCTGELATQLKESPLKMEGIGQEDKDSVTNLSKRDTVVEIRDVRKKARKLHPKNVSLQEGAETIKVERMRMLEETKCSARQGEMKNLTGESEQLSNEQMETDKIEKQRSTFFKVNNEQLNEEFACLLKTKSKLKEEILMVTMQYEVKLSNLQLEIQKLLKCKAQPCKLQVDNGEADKMEQNFTDGSKLIRENVAELTAPHEAVHGDESGLSLSPSEVSAQLVLKDNEVARAMEDEQCITAATGERDEQREVVMGTASLERTNAQQPAVMAFSSSALSGGSRLIRDRNRRTELSGERGLALESAEGERSHTQQLRSTQRLEQQALHDQTQVRRRTHRAESAGLGSQEDGDAPQQPLDALGLAAPAGESLCADAEQKELDLATAAQEIQALKERLRMLHAPRAEEDGASRQSVTLRQEEFQLQFEALRISLSQICAAQLELQKEHLQAEREACLRRQEQELHATHAHEMQQLCEKHQQEVQSLRGQHSGPKETQSEEMDSLKTYYQEQQIQLEERHNQEMERLRADYQQQAKCTEERYTAELIMLKRRLQDLARSRALLRPSSFSREPQFSAPKVEEGAEHKRCAELECLVDDRGRETQAAKEEDFPSAESHHDSVNGGVWSTEGHEAVELIQALERQHQERVEEEIAKVIVQMSIEFAQQTELTRIAERSRETMSVQKADAEPGGAEEFQLNETSPDNQALPRGDGEVSGLEVLPKMTKVTTQYTEKEEEGNSRSYGGNEDSSESLPPVIRPDASPDIITDERNLLRQANQSLRQVLSDVLKTTAAAEETIGRYVEGLLDVSLGAKLAAVDSSLSAGAGGDALPDSCHGSKAESDDVSMWSEGMETDEGLTSSLLTEAEPQLEREEYLMSISSRLQAAVEKLLVAITKTANQLEHARITQTELMRESFRRSEEMTELLRRQEELQESLSEEAAARQQLALELQKAEGLIDGYSGERTSLEQQLQKKQELQLHMEQELLVTNSRLQELEQERRQVLQERELLSRQKGALKDDAGARELRLVEAAVDVAPEADLLEETEKLMKEKVEVQLQAEKESSDLLKQVRCLETELEDQVNRVIELEEAHKAETNDLRQQIQALEKQLEKNRRFLDEQAIDREHERDVFQQEIMKLEVQLKNPQKQQASSDPYNKEVDQLTAQLRDKSDCCSELLLRTEQLQRDVQNGNEENERLEMRVRELEQALLASAEMLQVEQKKPQPPAKGTPNTTLEVELQTEREALDRKEKEISNLEEQLEQFREELENKSEEVQQLQMQLEIQNKELSSQQQDLQHKDELLKALEDKDELLREFESRVECMKGEQERLKKNSEEEIDQLNDVIEKLQQELLMIAHKASDEHLHDTQHLDTQAREEVHLTSEDFDELKHKMKQLTEELTTLQASHTSLLEKYKSLQEVASRELDEEQKNKWNQLEKAFQEKTAECVVMQVQVQALEESAGYRMASLSTKIEELETSVEEKDSELKRCRLQVKQTQAEAAALHHKVSELEDKLREMVAAVQFNQVGPGATQEQSNVQTKEPRSQKLKRQEVWEESTEEMADVSYVSTDSPLCSQVEDKASENVPVTKVVILTEKLRELEEGLCNMQKDQELQKQLLSSSEVEVVEYEKRLAVLIDLLNQMTTKPRSQTSLLPVKASVAANEDDPAASTDLLQELRQEVVATREELSGYRERNDKLQDDLQGRDATILQLKEELHQASVRGPSVTEVDPAAASRLLQEVREEAAATKEELSSYREKNDKLQEELQVRDVCIAQLQEELRQIKEAVRKSEEDLQKEAGKYSAGKPDHSEKRRETSTNERNNSQMDWTDGTDRTTQTQGTVCVDKEVQTAVVQRDSNLESGEMAQVKREYAEKVRQGQDGSKTEEELNSFREQNDKLQEELQVRDVSIAKLQEELEQMRKALKKSGKELKKEAGKYSDATKDCSEEMRETSTKDRNTSQMDLTAGTDRTTQTHDTKCTNVEVQTSQVPHDSNVESKETAEVISEYTEKIGHMQERHDEEVKRHRGENDKLQEELHVRDVSIAKLRDELAQKNEALRKSEEKLKNETGKYSAGKHDHSAKTRKTSTKGRNASQMDCTASADRAAQTISPPCTDAGVQTRLVQQGSSVESEEMGEVNSENTEETGQVQDGHETAEELNSYREQKDKLHAELEVKDQSIAKLQVELAQIKEALRKSEEDLKKEAGKYSTGKRGRSAKVRETSTKEGRASQMDCSAGMDRTPQTPSTTYADVGVQTISVQHDTNLESEEMAEVISEYTEKIGQMQDLHAAEIMDMEARHICESEGFKKEKEALQEECKALRAVIKDLYDSEATSPRLEHIPAAQVKDGSMSDSGSDWSQQTSGDAVVLHQEFRTTPEGARRDNETDLLPDRIKSLLREVHQEGMQVLSLSEMPLAEGEEAPDVTSVQLKCQGWLKERESLLTSVDKLKALISTMQIHRERESGGPFVEASKDWRAELLQAVQQVFTAERSVLKSSMYSHIQQLDTSDAVICLNQLEQKLTEQDAQQREAMEILQSADRDSLLMEISQLKAQLQQLQLSPRIAGVAEQQPGLEKRTGVSLNPDALHSESILLDELKAELAQTKLELESTLKAQQKHLAALDTLRSEVTEKAAEVDGLNNKLIDEQKKSRELQWAFEKEKCKAEKKEQNEREEIEDMRLLLLEEQKKVAQLSEAVEKEKRTSTQLKQQVDHGLAQHQSQSSREQGRISELQVQLESAQARALELESALERERELYSQRKQHGSQQHTVQANAEDECVQMDASVLESLHSQLEDKQAQVVQLLGEVEGLKLEVIRVRLECDEERQAGQQGLRALQELQEGEQRLRAQVQELQLQVDRKTQQALKLQLERDQLQDQLSQVQGLGETLQPSAQTSLRKTEGEFGGLSEDGAFQQTLETDPSSISRLEFNVASLGAVDPKLTDTVIEQLHHIASKIKTMTSSTKGRASAEEVDSEGLAWLQNSVQSVISQLQQAPALSPAFQSTALPASGSSNSLTERLLRQNAELTGFVSRLTEEKNDLRNSLVRLEKELRHAGPRGLGQGNYSHRGVDHKDTVEILLASAREGWNRERMQLEKCLHQAEAEVSRLRGKIRADSLWDFADSNADSAALKRIYVKYLRSESFRKALIYQKKYLLLLLGSFQDCEAATLSLISRMGGRSSQSLDTASRRPRGFTRFRSAARVFIALSRMRYLVRRWYKTTEAGSSSSAVGRNGQVPTAAIEGRRGSPYLHPGNVDGYGDLRGSSRGLTGRDSARFNTAHAETGSLTCSHLQNYDPDRALSDYITRLEALQRRLGSVQSGSFSYAQLHFGIRR